MRVNLSGVEGDVSTNEGVKKVFDCATELSSGGVQHVVTSIGGVWQKGRLVDQTLVDLNKALQDYVTGPFLLFTSFAPYLNGLKGGGTFTMVTCAAATEYRARNTSLMSVGCAAVMGLSLAARAEYASSKLAVSELYIKCRVHQTPDAKLPAVDPYNVGSDLIGAAIAASIGGRVHDRLTIHHRDEARSMCVQRGAL